MNDLTFENTDKVFPAIQYQNGWVWVDKDADISVGLLVHRVGEVYKSKGYFRQVKNSGVYKIIAQTPDLDLEGVPVVEVDDQLNKLASNKACEIFGNDFSMASLGYQQVFKEGYKAAQSKGCYTEEQVKQVVKMCLDIVENNYPIKTFQEILQSIRPKIVVETKEREVYTGVSGSTSYPIFEQVPITYQKNGRTYFKLKNTYERS